ncbi:MAG: type IV pilus assembly protein PilM [Nitrospirae bacterium]|nr:type IV pilus assembly protein PilM [Nitrospirota bacterium]
MAGKNIIGIDIGSSSIKIAQLNAAKKGYELALFNMLPVAHGIISNDAVHNVEGLAAHIKDLLANAGIKKADAVVGFSGVSSVVIKRTYLPFMTEDDIPVFIKREFAHESPFDINDAEIDFHIIGVNPQNEEQLDVIFAAARRDILKNYIDAISLAGLNIVIVDTEAFALSNVFEANYGIDEKNTIAIINVGASKTNIVILKNGIPISSNDIPTGGNRHSNALVSALNIGMADAERLKKGANVKGLSPEGAASIIDSASDEIFADIYRALQQFIGDSFAGEIDKIYICGGAALTKGFPIAMSERFNIKTEMIDPFRDISIPDKFDIDSIKSIAPMTVAAVGLAMRRHGDWA